MASNNADTTPPPEADAYELLSRPTLEYTDEEVAKVVADLRRRRELFLKTGKPDRPKVEKVAREKLSKDEKARNTAELMAKLVIPGLGPKA